MRKLKRNCCKKFERKAKACKGCPVMAVLGSKKRRRKLGKIKKRLEKKAR